MKIVIDIPEEDYKTLSKMSEKEKVNELSYYERIIADGTPLPKGHGDLIDRKKLGIAPIDSTDLPLDRCLMVYLAEDVDGAPAIIEADKGEQE